MSKAVIKILKGSLKGRVYTIKDNMLFGRTKGDIILKDGLVSDPHAKIEIDSDDQMILIDQDSKNGIFVDGELKNQIILEEGVKFSMGDSEFQITIIKFPEEIWSDIFTEGQMALNDKDLIPLEAFSKEIHLHFLNGSNQGKKRVLAYGPRFFGSESPDGALFDHNTPKKAFAFIPNDDEILFKTSHPEIVLLNGENISKQAIQDGDIISIDSLKMQVQLKNPV